MDELKLQIDQLYGALEVAGESEKAGIQQLIQDLNELMGHCNNVDKSNVIVENETKEEEDNDECDVDDEFVRFQREMEDLERTNDDNKNVGSSSSSLEDSAHQDCKGEEDSTNILKLLSNLEGMKCKAPFEHQWGRQGYHNAIVFTVETVSSENGNEEEEISSLESVSIRVIFTHPLTEAMKPCQFFLEGRCRFSGEECKYSHGEMVELSSLREFCEPNFSSIKCGARILAKYTDDLWYNGTVSNVTESGECEIMYDLYNESATLPFKDIIPLDNDSTTNENLSEEDDDSDSSNSDEEFEFPVQLNEVWSNMNGSSALGVWEKHTKGIGSRLMHRMGYVLGTGLGKLGEGRIEPVDAVILPPGRSLDKCMELKEKAGSSSANLFSVERRLKRIQKKEMLRAEQMKEKADKADSVFNFLNSRLNLSKNSYELKKSKAECLTKESVVDLNKKLLNIGESIKQVQKDIAKCKEGLKRHEGKDKSTADKMKQKLDSLNAKLTDLEQSEVRVSSEQKNRNDKKKLLIF